MKLTVVDVFAERAFAGNQLAVVHDAASLSDEQMQAIAVEMNFSETTFITARTRDSADVRIFTPAAELPFAGHPTLGTAWLLTNGSGEITLNLAAGKVPVSFADDGIGWLIPPAVSLGPELATQTAAELIGLPAAALHPDYPCLFGTVGPRFLLLGLRDLTALGSVTVDADLFRRLQRSDGMLGVFVFAADSGLPGADYAARMFFAVDGIREDPATGSANAAFAAYLWQLRREETSLVVDQGVEMGRPSRLYLRVGAEIAVGGRVQQVFEAELSQLPAA